MGRSLGWLLQVAGMVLVGSALLVGLLHEALRTEVVLLGVGGGLFLLGRHVERRGT